MEAGDGSVRLEMMMHERNSKKAECKRKESGKEEE
jgi:hypothetical protein